MTVSPASVRPDDRAERQVERLGPRRQPGQDLRAADDDLDREERRRRPTASRTSVGRSRWVRQATTATRQDDQPDDGRDPAMQDVGGGRRRSAAGTSVPPISGQSGKTSAESVAVTCDPNSSSANVAAARERREQREALARAAARRGGPGNRRGRSGRRAGPTSSIAAARCAVTDSPLLPRRTVSRPSHAWNPTSATAASDGQRSDAPVAVVAEGQDREPQDLEADDRRDRPVDPLDPGLRVAQPAA